VPQAHARSARSAQPACSLPERPLVSIRSPRTWVALEPSELWAYRELLYFLAWRDVKVRYKQTLLGVAWAVIQPLATMLVFALFFGKFLGVPSDGIPYPIFAFAGLLPWTFFSNAVTSSGNSLVGSANLVTKVYCPRMIIPAAATAAGLVDFAIPLAILLGMMAYYGVPVTAAILMLPVLIVLTALLALGVGLWTAALNVKYRDVRYALPFAIQLTMFVSPVIYPPSVVPEAWRWLLSLNPLTGIIQGYRASLLGGQFDIPSLATAAAITLAVLVWAAYDFRRMEKGFADVI
jgi:lipopolysaccharide transport system permease protein